LKEKFMKSSKLLAFAVAIVLLAGMSIQAQKRKVSVKAMPLPVPAGLQGKYVAGVGGSQASQGIEAIVGFGTHQVLGWNVFGQTTGDLSGHIFMSINYNMPTVVEPGDQIGSILPLPSPSRVTSGSWIKLIYVDGVYTGSISGRIVGGTVDWDARSQTQTVSLDLVGESGTGAYDGNVGVGTFIGTVEPTETGASLTGTLTLIY
jgi:hypothetical protein